jgi:hypothetical protein
MSIIFLNITMVQTSKESMNECEKWQTSLQRHICECDCLQIVAQSLLHALFSVESYPSNIHLLRDAMEIAYQRIGSVQRSGCRNGSQSKVMTSCPSRGRLQLRVSTITKSSSASSSPSSLALRSRLTRRKSPPSNFTVSFPPSFSYFD